MPAPFAFLPSGVCLPSYITRVGEEEEEEKVPKFIPGGTEEDDDEGAAGRPLPTLGRKRSMRKDGCCRCDCNSGTSWKKNLISKKRWKTNIFPWSGKYSYTLRQNSTLISDLT